MRWVFISFLLLLFTPAANATINERAGTGLMLRTHSSLTRLHTTFQTANAHHWTPSTHPLGRGTFDPHHVRYGKRGLKLTVPNGSTNGGELQSKHRFRDGQYQAKIQTCNDPGAISAFFLYLPNPGGPSAEEFDFEIPAGKPYRIMMTVWTAEKVQFLAQRIYHTSFDPSAQTHQYGFVRHGSHLSFRIDGIERFSYEGASTAALTPIFNLWYPTWLQLGNHPGGCSMRVHQFDYQQSLSAPMP